MRNCSLRKDKKIQHSYLFRFLRTQHQPMKDKLAAVPRHVDHTHATDAGHGARNSWIPSTDACPQIHLLALLRKPSIQRKHGLLHHIEPRIYGFHRSMTVPSEKVFTGRCCRSFCNHDAYLRLVRNKTIGFPKQTSQTQERIVTAATSISIVI